MRMGRYLSGPGDEPVPALVPQYLAALEDLSDSLYAHSSASAGELYCCTLLRLFYCINTRTCSATVELERLQ